MIKSAFNAIFSAMFLVTMLTGCDQRSEPPLVMSGKTMGTQWRVSVAKLDSQRRSTLFERIQQQLDADDQELSTWKADSVLSRFNRSSSLSPQPISRGMADIVTLALRIGQQTEGAMDITIGSLVDLWGFGPTPVPEKTPTPALIASTKQLTGLGHLQVIQRADGQWLQKDLPQLSVDLSTMGEGYAADHLARLMESEGISDYLVSVGGALISRGTHSDGSPWRVAIQQPSDQSTQAEAVVDLQGHGISTSGDYRNYYELDGQRISHIIDPITGKPIQHHLASVTVIATTALEADGWDTGLMVLGKEKAQQLALSHHLAVLLISRENGRFVTWASPAFRTFLVSPSKESLNNA